MIGVSYGPEVNVSELHFWCSFQVYPIWPHFFRICPYAHIWPKLLTPSTANYEMMIVKWKSWWSDSVKVLSVSLVWVLMMVFGSLWGLRVRRWQKVANMSVIAQSNLSLSLFQNSSFLEKYLISSVFRLLPVWISNV